MRKPFRALSVEPVEDRSLPSTFLFIDPGFSHRSFAPVHEMASAAHFNRGWEQARPFQAEAFTAALLRVQFSNDAILFIQDTPTGFQIIPVTVTVSSPTPIQGPTADGGGSGGAGQGGGDTGIVGTGNGPVASPRGPARTGATSSPTGGTADVAVAPVADQTNTTRAATTEQAAASAAAQVLVQSNQPVANQPSTLVTPHAAYAFTAITPEAEEGADVVPPDNPEPMPGPAPTPVPDPGDVDVGAGVVEVAAAAVAPVAGLVPLDLSALSTGASQFLGRVADLAPVWPEAMPGFNDTLWVAAAALLTGGGVYAAGARSATKPARDAVAGALSEWERRNGRVAG